jgi:hypothetical protein
MLAVIIIVICWLIKWSAKRYNDNYNKSYNDQVDYVIYAIDEEKEEYRYCYIIGDEPPWGFWKMLWEMLKIIIQIF